jgi:hypothetical protein
MNLTMRLQNIVAGTLLKAIEIYHEATTENNPNFAVLKFWIGLEGMMRLGEDRPVRDVARRLQTAFRMKPTIWDLGVRRLFEKRNQIVHRGVMDADLQDVYFAKTLYEHTLWLLLGYGKEYKTVEAITTLYEMGNKDRDALGELRRAVEHLFTT